MNSPGVTKCCRTQHASMASMWTRQHHHQHNNNRGPRLQKLCFSVRVIRLIITVCTRVRMRFRFCHGEISTLRESRHIVVSVASAALRSMCWWFVMALWRANNVYAPDEKPHQPCATYYVVRTICAHDCPSGWIREHWTVIVITGILSSVSAWVSPFRMEARSAPAHRFASVFMVGLVQGCRFCSMEFEEYATWYTMKNTSGMKYMLGRYPFRSIPSIQRFPNFSITE